MLLDLTEPLKYQGDSCSFSLEGTLPQDALPEGIALCAPVLVSGTITAIGHRVALVGNIQTTVRASCALCLCPVTRRIDCAFDAMMIREGYENEQIDAEEQAAEEDAIVFQGSACDLTWAVAEAVNLQLPMRFVCSESCKGLCPVCGADLNHETCGCAPTMDSPFSALAALYSKDE
jgi:uncharacterized protein